MGAGWDLEKYGCFPSSNPNKSRVFILPLERKKRLPTFKGRCLEGLEKTELTPCSLIAHESLQDMLRRTSKTLTLRSDAPLRTWSCMPAKTGDGFAGKGLSSQLTVVQWMGAICIYCTLNCLMKHFPIEIRPYINLTTLALVHLFCLPRDNPINPTGQQGASAVMLCMRSLIQS